LASADHNPNHYEALHHQGDVAVNFYIHANSIGTTQGDRIADAAKTWELETPLQFTRKSPLTGVAHDLQNDSGINLVWEDNYCPDDWPLDCETQFEGVRSSAGITWGSDSGDEALNHTTHVDTIFKQDIAWEAQSTTAECYGTAGDRTPGGSDDEPGKMAPGDNRMWKGDKNDNGTFDSTERDDVGDYDDHADQFHVAFHEFVHWQAFDDNLAGGYSAGGHLYKRAINSIYQECWSDTGHGRTAEAVEDGYDDPAATALYNHGH
jgi:hypothetical protein